MWECQNLLENLNYIFHLNISDINLFSRTLHVVGAW